MKCSMMPPDRSVRCRMSVSVWVSIRHRRTRPQTEKHCISAAVRVSHSPLRTCYSAGKGVQLRDVLVTFSLDIAAFIERAFTYTLDVYRRALERGP